MGRHRQIHILMYKNQPILNMYSRLNHTSYASVLNPSRSTSPTNWEHFVDPTRVEEFDREVLEEAKHEQDIFDDQILTGIFHWHPDQYQEQTVDVQPKLLKRKTVRFQEKTEIRMIQHRLHQSLSIEEEKRVLSKKTVDEIFSNDTCVSDEELLKSTSAIFSMNFEDSNSSSCSDSDDSSNTHRSSGYNGSHRTSTTSLKTPSYSFNVNVQSFVPGRNMYATNLKL